MNKILIALVLAVVMSGNAYAEFEAPETLKTNIDGVIIKNLVCNSSCYATLVNRNSEPLVMPNVIINLKLFDKDNDPIGSCKKRFDLDANSGMFMQLNECNGDKAKSVTATATSNY